MGNSKVNSKAIKAEAVDSLHDGGKTTAIPHYSRAEENINVRTHAIGFVLSIIALAALLEQAMSLGDALAVVSFSIFGLSLIFLYGTSTIYHSSRNLQRRSRLRILDHISIYVLIWIYDFFYYNVMITYLHILFIILFLRSILLSINVSNKSSGISIFFLFLG